MFARTSSIAFFVLSIALLAVATSTTEAPTVTVTVTAPASTATSVDACNSGAAQCCASVVPAASAIGGLILGLLGILIEGVDVLLGVDCDPVTIIGSGSDCTSNVVCCEDNNTNQLISIGCIPIIL